MILLDEPTTGLDPQARHLLWERLHRLKREGVTIVLTTHYMDEAEQLCDRLVIMDRGRIVAEGPPRAVDRRPRDAGGGRGPRGDDETLAATVERVAGGVRVEHLPERTLVYADDGDATSEALVAAGVAAHRLSVRRSTLEDVFLHLAGRTLVD